MAEHLYNKKVNIAKLQKFGFTKKDIGYFYTTFLLDGQFRLNIIVTDNSELQTKVFENETNSPYTLHLVEGAKGSFVGKIKEEYNSVLNEIFDKCFDYDVFKSNFTKQVIKYVQEKYNDEPEYLWKKFPNNALCRRKDNSKWYLLLLTVSKNKLGLKGKETIEIIDLREDPQITDTLLDNKKYFPGYHMNKKHWITIVLDGSVGIEEIQERIDRSYNLAKK